MILDLEAGIVPRTSIVVLVRVASRVGVRGNKNHFLSFPIHTHCNLQLQEPSVSRTIVELLMDLYSVAMRTFRKQSSFPYLGQSQVLTRGCVGCNLWARMNSCCRDREVPGSERDLVRGRGWMSHLALISFPQ